MQPGVGQPRALPGLAAWLAVQHQEQQQRIADRTATGLALLWGALAADRLDESTPAWLHATTLQVEQQFRESEQVAFDFVQGSRWAVEPLAKELARVRTVFPTKEFQIAMRATGPAVVKKATQRGFSVPQGAAGDLSGVSAPELSRADVQAVKSDALALGKLSSTGVGVKTVLNGGRGEVQQLVVREAAERVRNRQPPIGWARFTEDSANGPCYFCALLASQGGVYYGPNSFDRSNNKIREFGVPKADLTGDPVVDELLGRLNRRAQDKGLVNVQRRAFVGDGPAKVHDHCRCSLRPVYRKDEDDMDERATFFLDQWKDMLTDLSDKGVTLGFEDKIKEFRRRYRRPPAYSTRPAISLAQMQRNRDAVAAVLGSGSPHARWWDGQISQLRRSAA